MNFKFTCFFLLLFLVQAVNLTSYATPYEIPLESFHHWSELSSFQKSNNDLCKHEKSLDKNNDCVKEPLNVTYKLSIRIFNRVLKSSSKKDILEIFTSLFNNILATPKLFSIYDTYLYSKILDPRLCILASKAHPPTA
jgi:hypothetical protein